MQDSTQQLKPKTWEEAVRPLLMSCKVSEKFGTNLVITPKGSAELHKVIAIMAEELDEVSPFIKKTKLQKFWSFMMGDW